MTIALIAPHTQIKQNENKLWIIAHTKSDTTTEDLPTCIQLLVEISNLEMEILTVAESIKELSRNENQI